MNLDNSLSKTGTPSIKTTSVRQSNTNYNLLSSIPKHVIQSIKNEGELFLCSSKFAEKLWLSFRKTDFTSQGILNFKLVQQLFERHQNDIVDFFKVTCADDFFNIFDQDKDGYLNEDEQVLIFSTLKEKLQICANNLLKIQEYLDFKAIMREIRSMERLITSFQNDMRQKIYRKELQIYGDIGEERLDDFYDKYDQKFIDLNEYKEQRRAQLHMQQLQEQQSLEDKLQKPETFLKLKPKKKLKEYQCQEKLVAIEERVEEALDFRKELKNLEMTEKQRVEKLQQELMEKYRENLYRQDSKEKDQLEIKLQEIEFKLIINMKKEFGILSKKNHLHEHEIKRIQGLATKNSLKMGINYGELKRCKNNTRQQNEIIIESKKVQSTFSPRSNADRNMMSSQAMFDTAGNTGSSNPKEQLSLPPATKQGKVNRQGSQTMMTTSQSFSGSPRLNNAQYLKNLIKTGDIIQFYLSKKYGSDLPVNYKAEPHKAGGDGHEKIEKILSVKKQSKLDILPSLTDLYDSEMNLKQNTIQSLTEDEQNKQKWNKRRFINEMLTL